MTSLALSVLSNHFVIGAAVGYVARPYAAALVARALAAAKAKYAALRLKV